MSSEWVGALANVATLVVILVTAGAAFVQLRHMRNANQIVAFIHIRDLLESAEFRTAQAFIYHEFPKRLADPHERKRALIAPPIDEYAALAKVGNVMEGLGLLVKRGMVDADLVCDYWAILVVRNWRTMAPSLFRARRDLETDALWENFEYLAVICEEYRNRHPISFPPGTRRMPVDTSQFHD